MLDPWDATTYPDMTGVSETPLDDIKSRALYGPRFSWAFDKHLQLLAYAAACGVAGEHGLKDPPGHSLAITKPRWTPNGLGDHLDIAPVTVPPGHLWQRRYYGRHFSVDTPVDDGCVAGPSYFAEGFEDPLHRGRYLAWTVFSSGAHAWHDEALAVFLPKLQGFRGYLNLELRERIPGAEFRLIELHLRPSAEFFPIYGPGAVRAIFAFHAAGDVTIPACGLGTVLVEPHHAAALDLVGECEERSWRARLHYFRNK